MNKLKNSQDIIAIIDSSLNEETNAIIIYDTKIQASYKQLISKYFSISASSCEYSVELLSHELDYAMRSLLAIKGNVRDIVFITIGGGSTIDCAKLAIFNLYNEGMYDILFTPFIEHYEKKGLVMPKHIAISTTVGHTSHTSEDAIYYTPTSVSFIKHEVLIPSGYYVDTELAIDSVSDGNTLQGVGRLADSMAHYLENIMGTGEVDRVYIDMCMKHVDMIDKVLKGTLPKWDELLYSDTICRQVYCQNYTGDYYTHNMALCLEVILKFNCDTKHSQHVTHGLCVLLVLESYLKYDISTKEFLENNILHNFTEQQVTTIRAVVTSLHNKMVEHLIANDVKFNFSSENFQFDYSANQFNREMNLALSKLPMDTGMTQGATVYGGMHVRNSVQTDLYNKLTGGMLSSKE